tara:strand:- start:78567 stop:79130 length:564 start_codon:yes stop_codon:yes gene_type:complete
MVSFLKKNVSTILILIFLALLFIPQTGMPIRVFFNRLIAFSPSEIDTDEQVELSDYNWPLRSLEGENKNLETSEGKVVLVNIWATWCPPCVAEMPSMQKLFDAYKDQVDFYFVSLENPETIQRFMTKKNYTFPAFTTNNVFPKELETGTFPTTYVISKSGKIVIDKEGAADWNSDAVHQTLDALLAE